MLIRLHLFDQKLFDLFYSFDGNGEFSAATSVFSLHMVLKKLFKYADFKHK